MISVAKLYRRTLRRHRYISEVGWVVSQETFKCRIQPKFDDSLGRVRSPEDVNPFLSVVVFRDNTNAINSYTNTDYGFSCPAEAAAAAQSGTDLMIGDRIVEEDSGYILIVRSIPQYRDGYLNHDEIGCSEASQLDKKWIEPITVKSISGEPTGRYYDSIRRQFIKIESNDQDEIDAFGIIQPFDSMKFSRDVKVLERTDVGKELNDRLIIYMDADFPVDENVTFNLRGKDWKVEFIRDSFPRVLTIGVTVWKQRGASGDTSRERAGHLTE